MEKNLLKEKNTNLCWQILLCITIIVSLVLKVFYPLKNQSITNIKGNFFYAIAAAAVIWVLFSFDFKKHKDGLFYLAFGAWGLIVCALHSYCPFPVAFELALCTLGCFAMPFSLNDRQRQCFFKIFLYLFSGVFFVLGALGIAQVIAFTRGTSISWINELLVRVEYERLVIILHPNLTATNYGISTLFLIMIFASAKKVFAKVYAAVALIVSAICLSFTDSRTALVGTMLGVGICLGSWYYQKCKQAATKKKVIICIAVIFCGIMGTYVLTALPKNALNTYVISTQNKASEESVPAATNSLPASSIPVSSILADDTNANGEAISSTDALVVESEAEPTEHGNTADETPSVMLDRGFVNEDSSLNGRMYIWEGVFSFIKEHPMVLITGYTPTLSAITEQAVTYIPEKQAIWNFSHMHNGYLFILTAFGLPGLLLELVFLVKMAVYSFKLIFLKKGHDVFPFCLLPSVAVMLLFGELLDIPIMDVTYTPSLLVISFVFGYITFYATQKEQ